MSIITVFVTSTSGGGEPVVLHISSLAYVGDLKKAVIAELKLEATPDKVRLRVSSSGAGGLRVSTSGAGGAGLDPRKSLCAADVVDKTELIVELIPSPVGACV
jgi:hypothetical protein